MPPVSHDGREDLSATQIEQLSRILIPTFRDAIRADLHAIRNDITGAIARHHNDMDERIGRVETRVTALERLGWKMIGAVGVLVFVVTTLAEWVKYRILGH